MKKLLFSMLICLISANVSAQRPSNLNAKAIKQLNYKKTSVPFYATRSLIDRVEPRDAVCFYVEEWEDRFKATTWKNWQLTQSMEFDHFMPSPYLYRRFAPENSNYVLCAINLMNPYRHNEYIVTATESTEYIDRLEGSFSFISENIGKEGGWVFLKQYMINTNMEITVSQILPEVDRQISTENNPSSFRGKRINTTYKVSAEGKFYKIKEITYKPITYLLNDLAEKDRNIWEGKEQVDSTRTF